MPKLVDYTSHIKIDEKMLIKGTLEYEVFGDPQELVRVYRFTSPNIVFEGHYSDWTDENNIAYTSLLQLTNNLDKILPVNSSQSFSERNESQHLKVTNQTSEQLLKEIKEELKKVRFYLSTITENEIEEI